MALAVGIITGAGIALLSCAALMVFQEWRQERRRRRNEKLLAEWTRARHREAFTEAFKPTNGKANRKAYKPEMWRHRGRK